MRLVSITLIAFLLAGCAKQIGPNYKQPEVAGATATQWAGPVAPGQVDEMWWKSLNDPVLNRLVDDAIANNLDAKEAQARLREARANRAIIDTKAKPSVNASGGVTAQRQTGNGAFPINRVPGADQELVLFDGGFDVDWEIDLWGGKKRSLEAADARELAAKFRIQDVRIQVVAELVRNYAELRAFQKRHELAEGEYRVRQEIAHLHKLRVESGEAARDFLVAAGQRVAVAKAAIPEIESATRAAAYRISLLTGNPPEKYASSLLAPGVVPKAPRFVSAGVRSELLRRRPDIRAAEADLIGANAEIGVAMIDLYPRFSLLGGIGQQAKNPGDLLSVDSTRFSIGPSLRWPIFNFGRVRSQIAAAGARADAAAARYERTVLAALTESETAATRHAGSLGVLGARAEALRQSEKLAELAALRFKRGEDDRFPMLEAQSATLQAEQSLLIARLESIITFVSFSKALGGGQARAIAD